MTNTHTQDSDKEIEDPSIKIQDQELQILVVDDNKTSAQVLGWMLEILGHKAHLAYNGPDAITLAQRVKPDVLLLDIGLPKMNGYEMCQMMRKLPELEHSLFVAQTGWGRPEHRQFSQEAGFDYHLVKPIDIQTLKTLLSRQ